jgi:hypothetical protein
MSHYTIDELISRWKKEQLTTEQAIGQILLVLKELERRMKEARAVPRASVSMAGAWRMIEV